MSNTNKQLQISNEDLYPRSPDVLERETSDGGFSNGFAFHIPPMEKYWFDVHVHIMDKDVEKAEKACNDYIKKVENFNVKRIAAYIPWVIKEEEKLLDTYSKTSWLLDSFISNDEVYSYLAKIRLSNNIFPFLSVNYSKPDPELIEKAAGLGIRGIKLLNAQLICEGADPNVWLSDDWKKAFKAIEKHNLPVVWHVTQRLVSGTRNLYWRDGWKKGVKYTNEDLLQVFLKVVEQFPGIRFIGAHQLHVGWDRLSELFLSHKNLYVDSSIGCMVGKDQEIYEPDKDYFKNIFNNFSDRILFGTDASIDENVGDSFESFYQLENFISSHMRFFQKLRLPYDVIQKISHDNAEKILGINGI